MLFIIDNNIDSIIFGSVTHEGMSGTHDLREEPLVMILHEEHSELQVLEERFDAEGFDHVSVLHYGDHEHAYVGEPTKGSRLSYKGDS
jgi:hypothetical protein